MRRKLLQLLVKLVERMYRDGEQPFLDYALRSSEEQYRLYEKKLSKCDGYKIKSAHQLGRAVDLYLTEKDGTPIYNWDKKKAKKYHDVWVELGGKPMIEWDAPHFEV